MGRRVMCYVDVGTWERWRPRRGASFQRAYSESPTAIGRVSAGSTFGKRAILEPIMARRLDLCKKKGFDGVDPDNLDGYENKTGFPLTYRGAADVRYVGGQGGARRAG